ncbi:MAG: hypothetical protein HYX72_12935 [Acidobacteria bacterium]|nr:hypothetical protein [Acidobacteriota bacterium]
MSAATIPELLLQAGAELRGNSRFDCPECHARRTGSYNAEVFHCHKCGWSGNAWTLARELGMEQRRDTHEEQRQRQIVRREAEQFTEWARQRRIASAALIRDLDRYEAEWRRIGQQQLAAGQSVGEEVFTKLQVLAQWQERADARYQQLCEFEQNAAELYREFAARENAA